MQQPPFDPVTLMTNFQGMEDVAEDAIRSFIAAAPRLLKAVESAVQSKDNSNLILTAHTLKGAVSNFYAEPSRQLAAELEKMAETKSAGKAELVLSDLKTEIARLCQALEAFLKARGAA